MIDINTIYVSSVIDGWELRCQACGQLVWFTHTDCYLPVLIKKAEAHVCPA